MHKQKDIINDRKVSELAEQSMAFLEALHKRGHLRHGLAGMALAMQSAMTHPQLRDQIAHADNLELIMRGVYTSLTGTGEFNPHPVEKISSGYLGLMIALQPERKKEIYAAFQAFEKVLNKR